MNKTDSPFLPGDIFLCKRYVLLHLIDQGAFSEVYKLVDKTTEELVAVKWTNDEDSTNAL